MKILKCDRGGEYISKDFDIFCSKEGIKKKFTTTYIPQQNGVFEKKYTLGAILAMLPHVDLPNC